MHNGDHTPYSGWSPIGETHRALHEVAAERIRTAIIDGDLHPGERLVEDRLAQQLAVSRHPVREALRTLQLEGFVDISPRRGATVSKVTTDEASELFEVLSALDGLACRLAAETGDSAAILEIDAILERASKILDTDIVLDGEALDELAELNSKFHIVVATASGNHQLLVATTPLRDRIHWIQAAVNRRRPELSWAEHRGIRDAIAGRRPETAEALARDHIEQARIVYLSQRTRPGRSPVQAAGVTT